MQRDARRSREHWTGCYSFENIICDGNVSTTGGTRNGGLKMGGTYWYYVSLPAVRPRSVCMLITVPNQYQLDDATDFHDSAEPSTTACPLLPGQLLNVLNVPFHLSSGRSRNDSVSSTSSDLRTMNPADKFMNPRPVPIPQPKLARLNTSPTLPSFPNMSASSSWSGSPWSARSVSSSRGASSPASAVALRMFRLPRKPSIDDQSRSTSPPNKPTGLRAAFRQFTSPRTTSPEADPNRGRKNHVERELEISEPILLPQIGIGRVSNSSSNVSSRSASREKSPPSTAERHALPLQIPQLALRRGLEKPADLRDELSATSFQSHRRQRSQSREPSSLRNSLKSTDGLDADTPTVDVNGHRYQPLETLKETPSQLNTPIWPVTARKIVENATEHGSADQLLEKRLPTLPNTPSSVYPSSLVSYSPAKRLSEELRNLQSHFSEMTMSSTSSPSVHGNDFSHFSRWTVATAERSPSSNYCADTGAATSETLSPQRSPSSPYEVLSISSAQRQQLSQEDNFMSDAEMLPSTVSCSTISSCASTSPPSPSLHRVDTVPVSFDRCTSGKRYAIAPSSLPAYALPEDMHISETNLKTQESLQTQMKDDEDLPRIGIRPPEPVGYYPKHKAFPHSTSMQQLMDELSYLGDMIHR